MYFKCPFKLGEIIQVAIIITEGSNKSKHLQTKKINYIYSFFTMIVKKTLND